MTHPASFRSALATPLVRSVIGRILEELTGAKPGERAPQEAVVADWCDVSRTAVRKAFDLLEARGILIRNGRWRYLARRVRKSDRPRKLGDPLSRNREVEHFLMLQVASGKIQPGSRFSERTIAQQLGCSTAPVREALLALVPLGLFEKSDRRQGRAVTLDDQQAREIIEMRRLVEAYGLRQLMRAGRVDQRRQALEEVRRKTRALLHGTKDDFAAFCEADFDLHREIINATGNRIMIEQHRFIYSVIEFQLRNRDNTPARIRFGLSQHVELLDAILGGEKARANALLQQHMDTALETLLSLTDARQEPA